MFDKDLFYSLCEKYQVELSDKYNNAMIRDGEELKALNSDEVKMIFTEVQTYFTYDVSEMRTKKQLEPIFEISEHPLAIAC